VLAALLARGIESVLDLGCGKGELLVRLAREPRFRRIVGIDASADSIFAAEARLAREGLSCNGRISLEHTSIIAPDRRLDGFGAAVLLEVIEHIDPARLSSMERTVFQGIRAPLVIVTTPNSEYNVLYCLPYGRFRHPDHRFEWTRARFRAWACGVARRNGYEVALGAIGEPAPLLGSATQMATFARLDTRTSCPSATHALQGRGEPLDV
jgi:small RNA 2'-O-methyltransferase